MKILLFLVIFLNLTVCCFSQKQRLEGDDSRYLCLNDSISEFVLDSLRAKGQDSIITVLYDYDNGRMQNNQRIVIWQFNGKGYARVISGCDRIINDTLVELDLTQAWEAINNMTVGLLTSQIKPYSYASHGMGHFVTIHFGSVEFSFYVRDDQGKATETLDIAKVDARIRVVKWIVQALK